MSSLDQALAIASPRLNPRSTPLLSLAIYIAIFALWIVLFLRGLHLDSIFAWSAGILYVCYDSFLLVFVTWRTLPLRNWQPASPSIQELSPPSVGIIIAAHNEAAVLAVTIDALRAQSDPPEFILIADDGSNDATRERLFNLYGLLPPDLGDVSTPAPQFPALRWLRLPHGGKARALNAAIARLKADVLLTVDADTLLAPDAVHAMRQAFMQGLLLISGAFAGFRREALLTVGGFDAECLVEDYEVIHRLHRWSVDHGLGWSIRVLGNAHARTDAPGTVQAFLRQRRRWFAGFLQTQYWNRDMTGNARFGQLGTIMLPIKAVDTLQPIYGFVAFALLLVSIATGHGS